MNNMNCLDEFTNKAMVCESSDRSISEGEVLLKSDTQCRELKTDEDTTTMT